MTHHPILAAPVLALALWAVPALADPTTLVGQTLGMSVAEVATALEAGGYEIVDFETDDREFEIEVLWNGRQYEIDVERSSGTVSSARLDD
jgi:hypothetical protein